MRIATKSGKLMLCCGLAAMLLTILASLPSAFARNVTVTSANPPSAPQATTGLNVTIGGSGFKKGAMSRFFVSGSTTDTGGVTVNSTTFVNPSSIVANITIADGATVSNFDIVVQNTDGTTGKGSQLFEVTPKGTPVGCTTLGTPSAFSLVTGLNFVNSSSGTAQYSGPNFGQSVRVRPVVLTAGTQSRTVLVAAVGSGGGQPTPPGSTLEIFILDPATGKVLDNTVIVGTQVQPHITVPFDITSTDGAFSLEAGDVNNDGIPDFVWGSPYNNAAYVALGSMDANGVLSYGPAVSLPLPGSNPGMFGWAVAMGNLDGNTKNNEDVVVGAFGGGAGSRSLPGQAFIYQWNGSTSSPAFDLFATVSDPLPNPKNDDYFAKSLAVADVTGDGIPDLIVGAPDATVSRAKDAGRVYVFPGPLPSSSYFTLTAGIQNEYIGYKVGSGPLSSATANDVIATTYFGRSTLNASIFSGPITGDRTSPNFTYQPYPGLTGGWSTGFDVGDMTGDGRVDVLVGAPNAATATCSLSIGAADLYLSNASNPSQPTLVLFQPPLLDLQKDSLWYGWGDAAVPFVPYVTGSPLLLVGEKGLDLGGVTRAGQVYVYKKN